MGTNAGRQTREIIDVTPSPPSWPKRIYRHPLGKQVVDQALHAILGALLLWPAAYGQLWLSAALVGLLREIEQMRAKRLVTARWWEGWGWHWRRSLDVFFWGVGGAGLGRLIG